MMKEIEENEPHRNFLAATEESFGYMNHNNVRDKDGVCSRPNAELTLWYKERGMTPLTLLMKYMKSMIFTKRDFYVLIMRVKKALRIGRIMDHFRSNVTTSFNNLEITETEDYLKRILLNSSGATTPLTLPKSNVLGYSFKNGDKMYLRPSGTEPKIKFYLMVNEKDGSIDEKKLAAVTKIEFINEIKETAKDL